MSVDTITTASQAYSLMSILKTLIPIIPSLITGIVAMYVVNRTYKYAKQGRREDVLYKERYKSFEEIAGYLYEISKTIEDYANILLLSEPKQKWTNDAVRSLEDKLLEIIKNEPNRRHLVFLSEETRVSYYQVYGSTLRSRDFARELATKTYDIRGQVHNIDPEDIMKLSDYLNSIQLRVINCLKLIFKDIDLPHKETPYTNWDLDNNQERISNING